MAESNKTKEISNERAELTKNFNRNAFQNTSNQIFARTQSTPLEDQKKQASSFKNKLKASQALKSQNTPAFIPGSNAANEFLSTTPNQPSSATSNTTTETQPTVKTTAPSTFTPSTTSSTFTPATITEKPAATTTTPLNVQKVDSSGSATTSSNAGAGAAAKANSLKSKLRLSSSSFTAPAFNPEGTAATTTTAKPTITPFVPGGVDQAALGDWSKPSTATTKTAEEKKADKNASPSKINLKSTNSSYEFRPGQAKTNLDIIPETKAENKQETAVKAEPVVENKKVEQLPPQPSDEFVEVTSKNKKPTRKYEKPSAQPEPKREAAPVKEVKPVETKKEEPSPKKEVKPEVKEVEKKHEEKSFATPAKSEVKIEIIMMTRNQFAEAVAKMTEVIKDRKIPEGLEKYRNREILNESLKKRAGGGQDVKSNKPESKQFDRGTQQQPTPSAPMGEGFERGTSMRKEVEEPPKEKTFVRLGLTPEEKAMKEKLNSSVNAWMAGKKGEKDPEEVIRKDIKFNLNIITLDNFDKIKDIILDIASQKFDNCRRVAEFIVENAWTQKQYVNIYAKLCDFLGRQDKLNFDESKDPKKKKNDFKLQIMKQIQTVFENETIVGIAKKPVEEMNAEEKSIYYMKRKQRILGNVSFIGELFLEKFLVIGIVRLITTSLLKKYLVEYDTWMKSGEKNSQRLFEDTLEGLLKFYEIIGQAVEEKESSTKTKEKEKEKKPSHAVANFEKIIKQINAGTPSENLSKFGEEDEVSLNDLFKIFNVTLEDGNLTTRLSSLIQNLVYRRDNKWAASLAKNSGPKTLKELHEEFEKEKLEEERRGEEYRDELRDNYYTQPQGRGGKSGRTEVSFQVVSDNKSSRQQEESKVDLSSLQVDQNIVFKPQRGKQQGGQTSQPAKPKVNYEQIEREFKDVYKLLAGETVEDKTNPEEELKKMAAKHGGRNVLQVYFRTFYDGRTDAVKKRLFIPSFLIEAGHATNDDLSELLRRTLDKMYEISCDYPGLDNHFAVLLLEYCKRVGTAAPLRGFDFSEAFYQNEESEFILEFYQDTYRAIVKNLEEEYKDLKDKVTEADLKEFAKKIKLE